MTTFSINWVRGWMNAKSLPCITTMACPYTKWIYSHWIKLFKIQEQKALVYPTMSTLEMNRELLNSAITNTVSLQIVISTLSQGLFNSAITKYNTIRDIDIYTLTKVVVLNYHQYNVITDTDIYTLIRVVPPNYPKKKRSRDSSCSKKAWNLFIMK